MNSRHLQFHCLCICKYFTVLCVWYLAVNIKGRIVRQHGPQHTRVDRRTVYAHPAQVCCGEIKLLQELL